MRSDDSAAVACFLGIMTDLVPIEIDGFAEQARERRANRSLRNIGRGKLDRSIDLPEGANGQRFRAACEPAFSARLVDSSSRPKLVSHRVHCEGSRPRWALDAGGGVTRS